jgi:hypothetical protein
MPPKGSGGSGGERGGGKENEDEKYVDGRKTKKVLSSATSPRRRVCEEQRLAHARKPPPPLPPPLSTTTSHNLHSTNLNDQLVLALGHTKLTRTPDWDTRSQSDRPHLPPQNAYNEQCPKETRAASVTALESQQKRQPNTFRHYS